MDITTKYAKEVLAGKIITGKPVKQACRRHINDLKNSAKKSYPYYYDEDESQRIFDFCRLFCRHSKGEWAGTPVILSDWQVFCLGSIFGWKRKSDDKKETLIDESAILGTMFAGEGAYEVLAGMPRYNKKTKEMEQVTGLIEEIGFVKKGIESPEFLS